MARNRNVLPLITISVLFAIMCIIGIARGSLATYDEIRTSTIVTNKELLDNEKLNESEKIIINMLKNEMKLQNTEPDMINSDQSIYVKYFEKHLSSPKMHLSKEKADEIVDLIKSMNRIMNLEKENDLKQMSIDGRGIAINIYEQIYQLCGLKIIYSMEGDIVQITDCSENLLYCIDNPIVYGSFNYYAFAMVFLIWFFLISLCIIITKKYINRGAVFYEKKNRTIPKLCLVSSSGGHWEQLQRLQPLIEKFDGFYVSEKTMFSCNAKYLMKQTDLKDKWMIPKMLYNLMKTILIWYTEKPDFVITTGTMVAYPFYLLARIYKKKFIYIETFSRIYDGTKAGKIMYKHSDLFIIQWETLRNIYPKAVYGGSIY
ncbi:MAG: Oligosaccharide biosynthesis protein Alg14-like protein [Clostridiaceae bacterium]|jgi:hypothetical protein|nr:Oligosaccharide biosynthesis protein Alg14-like protein [Clostridiaceae bacterium]